MSAKNETSRRLEKHTRGPLVVGRYRPTSRFLAVREHVAVMKPNGELVALTGSTDNDEVELSEADAKLYAAADDLLKACDAFAAADLSEIVAFFNAHGHSAPSAVFHAQELARAASKKARTP